MKLESPREYLELLRRDPGTSVTALFLGLVLAGGAVVLWDARRVIDATHDRDVAQRELADARTANGNQLAQLKNARDELTALNAKLGQLTGKANARQTALSKQLADAEGSHREDVATISQQAEQIDKLKAASAKPPDENLIKGLKDDIAKLTQKILRWKGSSSGRTELPRIKRRRRIGRMLKGPICLIHLSNYSRCSLVGSS